MDLTLLKSSQSSKWPRLEDFFTTKYKSDKYFKFYNMDYGPINILTIIIKRYT